MRLYLSVPICYYVIYSLLNSVPIEATQTKACSLQLLYVIFRHGDRTPNGPEELYPKDPYREEKYPLIGIGQLTNAGKQREFLIGRALRERYNSFLGPFYTPDLIEPISTAYNRNKMSLLLALAGLFPPKGQQIWNEYLNWQPIPYNYLPESEDKVLMGQLCPYYIKLYNEYIKTPGIQAQFEQYKNIFDHISRYTGLNITKLQDIYNLSFGLKAEEDYFLKLPTWTRKFWPDIIMKLAVKEYFVATGTRELRQMITGYFLQKMVNDMTLLINGTNTDRRIYLNSAHELNLATLLITLGIFHPEQMPNYGAYVIFELHKINDTYYIEIYYENYVSNKPVNLKIPGCGDLCSFNQFKDLIQQFMPPSPTFCYQK